MESLEQMEPNNNRVIPRKIDTEMNGLTTSEQLIQRAQVLAPRLGENNLTLA